MKKDAAYYKQRIGDLPSDLLDTIRDLYTEASSHRFICMSLSELCSTLNLEYDHTEFDKSAQQIYIDINSYLEKINLKLVPCSVPVDLSFYDKIFITTKPDLNNDEDCAAVKALVAAKKTPTVKDLKHINMMNVKLSNYNIMLRVFEGLFVVSSAKLDPHQRVALNNIISKMELPKEGLAYIRTCYTYSSEYRNRHCDYKNPAFCFKPLDKDNQLKVSQYLAAISASSNYKEPFNLDYPFINDLENAYRQLVADKPEKNDLQIKQLKRLNSEFVREEISTGFVERMFLDLKNNCYNYINSFAAHENNKEELCRLIAEGSPVLKNELVKNLYNFIGSHVTPHIEKLIPQNDIIRLQKIDLPEHREANFVYTTDDKQTSIVFPNIYYTQEKILEPNKCENFEEFLSYIKGNEEISTKSSRTNSTDKTSIQILLFNFFIRLILNPLFVSYDRKDLEEAIEKLNAEYQNTQLVELLFLRTLYFAFFEAPEKSFDKIKDKSSVLIGMFYYPELTKLSLFSLLSSQGKDDISDIYAKNREIFELYIYHLATDNDQSKYKWLHDLKGTTDYFVKVIAGKIRTFISENFLNSLFKDLNVGELSSTVAHYSEHREEFNNYLIFDEALRQMSSHAHKNLQTLIHHPIFANLIAPICGDNSINIITEFNDQNGNSCLDGIREEFSAADNIIKYLSTVKPQSDHTLAKLITGELGRLEAQTIKRNLNEVIFNKYSQLCDIFKIEYSFLATECIEDHLPKLGLMVVPIDMSLPKEARAKLKQHKIITTSLPAEEMTDEFLDKLCAAQMAFIIFNYVVPVNTVEVRLSRYMELTPKQNVYAIKFFNTLRLLMHGTRPFEKNYYSNLYAEQKNNPNFKLCISYLKRIVLDEIRTSPLKNYLTEKFGLIFTLMNVKSSVKAVKENSELSTEDRQKTQKGISSSLYRSSEHSFFKANSFDTKNLDSSLIDSKLKESAQIQDVITQIRIDEGTLDAESQNISEDIQTEISDTDDNKINYSSDNARKLIEAIKSLETDVIDINEFKGLCMSLKFMSSDAAIEEINDWSYENFDEPLLDYAPEENCIYISTDLL
ncbi:TerB-C domain-containing protein [Succinivibrio dextrinosolvens]|uniref:tellurite resistance TerB C-terminal domain-containing protein n=1 Tax=Succinivibrio dextrinosolvens TaxID=83771 RepID=UPI0008E1C8CE|nr:tellurite resistance TerB C-terminal domain-containing protein [Succinivibrio dextrinosolvens]SFS33966.1 TerB-C domain-containing protein [Succinivibrio dextrinosolvens]